MVIFGSDEWGKGFCKKLNESEAYKKAAETWEGDFVFIMHPDEKFDEEMRLYVDLWHGDCRGTESCGPDQEAEFIMSGPYTNWVKVAKKELDPIQGLMTGKFKLEGDMAKIMRATKAAVELVNCVTKVEDTEFPGF
ncbi:MAG: sterol carrier protein [Promethearchaeota archaeon]|nr:MAG: sterol carrier protein [Candidatus Lokiarchaeota archaeon]